MIFSMDNRSLLNLLLLVLAAAGMLLGRRLSLISVVSPAGLLDPYPYDVTVACLLL